MSGLGLIAPGCEMLVRVEYLHRSMISIPHQANFSKAETLAQSPRKHGRQYQHRNDEMLVRPPPRRYTTRNARARARGSLRVLGLPTLRARSISDACLRRTRLPATSSVRVKTSSAPIGALGLTKEEDMQALRVPPYAGLASTTGGRRLRRTGVDAAGPGGSPVHEWTHLSVRLLRPQEVRYPSQARRPRRPLSAAPATLAWHDRLMTSRVLTVRAWSA